MGVISSESEQEKGLRQETMEERRAGLAGALPVERSLHWPGHVRLAEAQVQTGSHAGGVCGS